MFTLTVGLFTFTQQSSGVDTSYWFPPTPYSYFAGYRGTNYGTVSDTLSTPNGTYPGNLSFSGGVLLPDGRVFCVPYNSATARIYGSALSSPLPNARVLSAYDNKF